MKKIAEHIFICFLVCIPSLLVAKDKQEWNKQMMAIYSDKQLSDSLKVIAISDLTYNYCIYYRIMDDEVLVNYFALLSPLLEKYSASELKVYAYRPVFFLGTDKESEELFRKQYIGYIQDSANPLTRHLGWMIIGKATIENSTALEYLFNALDEVKHPKYKKYQAETNQYISYHYALQGYHANQLKYALTSLELAKESGDIFQLTESWKDVGAAYYEDPNAGFLDEALEAYNQARTLFLEKLKIRERDIHSFDCLRYMEVLVTLGSIYQTKNYAVSAIEYLEEALKIATANNIVETQAFCHKELGILQQTLKNFSKAETHYLTTERLLDSYQANTIESNHIDYEIKLQLAALYQETGHYKASVAYYEAGIRQYRGMFDEEIMHENQRIAAYYEARKQEADIAALKAIVELKEKQRYYYWGITGVLLIALLAFSLLYYYKVKTLKQHAEQLKAEALLLELDRSKAEIQARLKQQESEQLQRKLSAGDKLLEHKNKVMDNLKAFFANHSELNEYKRQIENILMQQNRVESNVDHIKNELQDVPIDFYVRLQKQADNRLTPLDLKYCRLIYLKTASKDIAEQLFVDLKTVRVNKYRLKQKLKLGKDDDLYDFIEHIKETSLKRND